MSHFRLVITVVFMVSLSCLVTGSSDIQQVSPHDDDCLVESADYGTMDGYLASNLDPLSSLELPSSSAAMAPCIPGAAAWPCCLRPCACQAAGCGGGGGGGGGW